MNSTNFETIYKEVITLEAQLKMIDDEEHRRQCGQIRRFGEVTDADIEYFRKRLKIRRDIDAMKEDKAFVKYYRKRKVEEIGATINDIRKSYR